MNRAKNVVEYYVLNNKLKNIIRTGWLNWHVNRDRIESVAEHIYGTTSLAIAMHSEYEYDLDLKKIILMLAVHELEETVIGDLTAWDIGAKEKMKVGHEAVHKTLEKLLNGKQIEKLILEFDKRETNEAKFAYHIDKLECDLQCKLYGEENCVDVTNQADNKSFYDKRVQELLVSENGNWAKMWLECDRHRYVDDKNFMEVLDYAKNNDINVKRR